MYGNRVIEPSTPGGTLLKLLHQNLLVKISLWYPAVVSWRISKDFYLHKERKSSKYWKIIHGKLSIYAGRFCSKSDLFTGVKMTRLAWFFVLLPILVCFYWCLRKSVEKTNVPLGGQGRNLALSQLRICILPPLSFDPIFMKDAQYAESNEKLIF